MLKRILIFLIPLFTFVVTFFLPRDAYMIKSILSLTVLILVPYYFGRIFLLLLKDYFTGLPRVSRYLLSWLLGMIMTMLVMYLFHGFQLFNFEIIIGTIYVISSIHLFYSAKLSTTSRTTKEAILNLIPYIILIIISVAISYYFRSLSPFPLQSGNDNIFLSGLSQEILSNNFGNSNFFVYSYLPFIPVLLAIASFFSHVEPIHVLWFMPFLLYTIFSTGLYYFLRKKVDSLLLPLLVSIIFIFIFGFQGRIIDLINFREKNLFFVLMPLFYFFVDDWISKLLTKKKISFQIFAITLLLSSGYVSLMTLVLQSSLVFTLTTLIIFWVIFLSFSTLTYTKEITVLSFMAASASFLHAYLGFFVVVLFFLIGLQKVIENKKLLKRIVLAIVILCVIGVGIVFISNQVPDIFIPDISSENIFFGGQYNFDVLTKLNITVTTFSPLLLGMALLGVLLVIYKRNKTAMVYSLAFVVAILYVFIPINFSYRLIELLVPFLALFSLMALYYIRCLFLSSSNMLRYTHYLVVFGLLAFTIPQASSYVTWLYDYNLASEDVGITNFTHSEYLAATWIKENYKDNLFIYTSPELTRSITAISGKTSMLQSKAQEYQYKIRYTTPKIGNRCRQIFLNNYGLSSSGVSHSDGFTIFSIDTIDKKFFTDKKNQIRLINCSADDLEVIDLMYDDVVISIAGVDDENDMIYSFQDYEAAKKNYLVSIFDVVGDLRELRRSIFTENESEKAQEVAIVLEQYYYDGLPDTGIKDDEPISLIFISGSVALWSDDANEIQKLAAKFEEFEGFSKFFNNDYFNLVFEIPGEVFVFEIRK